MATIFKIKEIHPTFNRIVTTRNLYEEQVTSAGVILGKARSIKEYQTVLAVGPQVKDIQVGDIVYIDPRRYATISHRDGKTDKEKNVIEDQMHVQFNIPTYDLYDQPDGSCRQVLLLGDNDVLFVTKGEEFETAPLIAPGNDGLILPN